MGPAARWGFTLAEVLITLGIIGVVAAMTMPSLIAQHQKKVAVTRLKSCYSIISNAFLRAQSDYGDMEEWNFPKTGNLSKETETFLDTYFIPYLVGVEKLRWGSYHGMKLSYKYIDGTPVNSSQGGYFVRLNNGAVAHFAFNSSLPDGWDEYYYHDLYFYVDINGKAGPNVFGKDMFFMKLKNNKQLILGTSTEDRDTLIKNCRHGGAGCGQLIINDGWEIKDDYPW